MTQVPPEDQSVAPVLLQEPRRRPAAAAAGDWSAVLGPDEVLLWQSHRRPLGLAEGLRQVWNITEKLGGKGSADQRPDPMFALFALALRLLAVALMFPLWLLSSGMHSRRLPSDQSQTRYGLTNRACYLAENGAAGLTNVVSYPITATTQLGLGGRSVTFATRSAPDGQPVPQGFLDIPDAEAVYAMIKDIQKGQP